MPDQTPYEAYQREQQRVYDDLVRKFQEAGEITDDLKDDLRARAEEKLGDIRQAYYNVNGRWPQEDAPE